MKERVDPLGALLQRQGLISDDQLADVLRVQGEPLPFASVAYLLGYVEEEALVRALSVQRGLPGIVLGRSIVSLHNLVDLPREIALRYRILPVYEDERHVFAAVGDLGEAGILHEMEFIKGKAVIPHVAVHVCLAAAIRACYRLLDAGDSYWFGAQTSIEDLNDPRGVFHAVSDVDEMPAEVAVPALDVTDPKIAVPVDVGDILESMPNLAAGASAADSPADDLGLDAPGHASGARRILIADSDEGVRQLVARILRAEGHTVITAGTGTEAVQRLRERLPDLVILEVMLPEIPGFQICRMLKNSKRYGHLPVVLSVVGDSARRLADGIIDRYGADDLLYKPVGHAELTRAVAVLSARAEPPQDLERADRALFDRALEAYRQGEAKEAMATLRRAIEIDPFSARLHFVLGNVLQGQGLLYEAIEAYEATANLRPDYFPALSRLAYLYYRQGFLARAIDTWRRSLSSCTDADQAARIREFMEARERELAEHGRQS